MQLRIFSFLLFIIVLVFGCDYTPEGASIHEVNIPNPRITLVALDTSKINVLRGTSRISYSANLNNHTFQNLSVYLNNTSVTSLSSNVGYLDLESKHYSDGFYTLRFELRTATNSGSLADRFGAESFLLTQTYNVQIFNGAITTPSITEVIADHGVLKIKWQKYIQPGFQKYVLQRSGSPLATITDSNTTQWSDVGYVGSAMSYSIVTYVAGTTVTSPVLYANYPATTFTSYTTTGTTHHLYWQRNQFDLAFSYYRVVRKHACRYNHDDLIANITKIDSTNVIDTNAIIGGSVSYEIEAISKQGSTTYRKGSIETNQIGTPVAYDEISHLEYNPMTDLVYAMNNTNINIYNPTSFQLINYYHIPTWESNLKIGSDLSKNGTYLYYLTNVDSSVFRRINPSNISTEEVILFKSYLTFDPGYLYGICISDNNILVGLCSHNNGTPASLIAMNMNTRTFISSAVAEYPSNNLQMTHDNRYLICGTNFYSFTNNSLIKRGTVLSSAVFLNNDSQFVQIANNKLQIFRCSDMTVEKQIDIGKDLTNASAVVCTQDKYVGCEASDRGYLYIVDMTQDKIVKTIPITGGGFKIVHNGLFGVNRCIPISY